MRVREKIDWNERLGEFAIVAGVVAGVVIGCALLYYVVAPLIYRFIGLWPLTECNPAL